MHSGPERGPSQRSNKPRLSSLLLSALPLAERTVAPERGPGFVPASQPPRVLPALRASAANLSPPPLCLGSILHTPHFSCCYIVLGFSRQQNSCPKLLKSAFLSRPGSFTYEQVSPLSRSVLSAVACHANLSDLKRSFGIGLTDKV